MRSSGEGDDDGASAPARRSRPRRRRRQASGALIAIGYICAALLPIIGMLVAFMIAQDQSRNTQRHATRMYVLALTIWAAGFGYLLLR